MSLRRTFVAVALAASLVGLAACQASDEPTPTATASAEAAGFRVNDEPDAVAACLQPGDTALAMDTPGGQLDEAITYGDGDTAVILSHQAEQGPCAWDAYGRTLAERGYRVFIPALLVTPEGVLAPSVDWLTEQGVERYALVGASKGGAYSLAAAAHLSPAPALVAAVSSPTEYDPADALGEIGAITSPVLLIAGSDDDDFAAQAQALADAQPAATLLVVPSSAHGTELIATSPEAATALDDALADALG